MDDVHSCEICLFEFPSRGQLERHRRNLHPHDHRCEICLEVYSSPVQLQIHHQSCHGHVCEYCKRGFASPAQLQSHKKTHKEFAVDDKKKKKKKKNKKKKKTKNCEACGWRFTSEEELRGHCYEVCHKSLRSEKTLDKAETLSSPSGAEAKDVDLEVDDDMTRDLQYMRGRKLPDKLKVSPHMDEDLSDGSSSADTIYAPGLTFPRNLKFPDYPGDVEDENEDLEMSEEDCSQGVKLLEYLRAKRLKDLKDKESEDKDKESDYNEPEDTESEDNESEGEGKDLPPLFDPAAGNPLDRFLHVKDPVIEVEEWHGCPICGDLNKSHVVICCPWLKKIPKDQRPGPHYDIYCIDCGMLGRDCHSSGVAAVMKSCGLCWLSGHWSKSCPYYKPKNP